MALNLLVDIGNSRMKWALSGDDGAAIDRGAITTVTANQLSRVWHGLEPPKRIAVSNVRGAELEGMLNQWCREHWAREPWVLRSTDTSLGIENRYSEPRQLGSDRFAALLGARALSEGDLVVVDCGTAITIDLLDANNCFRGGAILPGPVMGAQILRQRAPGIAGVPADTQVPDTVFGTSTESCIASGTLYGTAGAIDRILDEMMLSMGGPRNEPLPVFSTGGDAGRLQTLVKHALEYQPDLVLRGLLEAVKQQC